LDSESAMHSAKSSMSGNADAAWIRPAVAPPDSGRGVHRLEFQSVDAAYFNKEHEAHLCKGEFA
jgi:hypothetical protein